MGTLTGIALIAVPILFNLFFALLGRFFDYPGILRQPGREVLQRFEAGGTRLVLLWWGLAVSAVLFIPVVILTVFLIESAPAPLVAATLTIGVLAGLVQALGLMRWPFLVPYLARTLSDRSSSEGERDAATVVFQAFNRYLGVAIGEHLGYAFTGAWTILFAAAMLSGDGLPGWLAIVGIVIGTALMLGSLEFVGPAEPTGWKLAAVLVPVAYTLWSAWLVALGIVVLVS
ncbi:MULTISPECIES: DUF4386 domain-containing protein [unclassified Diaminobutyricimonas]|uniref:DUF4386 domain-containing protein n=1 Tax=unclassified Diaminobutyricimonas TaxID=2643261 RepID=UPI0012F4ADA5|nr:MULTISPECIES: DUF4386 domain-containing protein [unclassified Diaminobutyricimonas]